MEIIVQDSFTHLPTFTVIAKPVASVSGATDETRRGNLLFRKSSYAAGYENYRVDVSPAVFGDTWETVNDTPSICGLNSSGLVTAITNGLGKIRIVTSKATQLLKLVFNNQFASEAFVWKGWTGATVSSVLANTIRDMMIPSKDLVYFSGYTQGAITATRNTNRWFTPDLSASALATDIFGSWSTANSGALISQRVFIGVKHWDGGGTQNLTAGRKLKFVAANGTVRERTILSRYNPPGYDLYLCVLSNDWTNDIIPIKIAGSWILETLGDGYFRLKGMGFQVHQDKRITGCVFDAIENGGSGPLTVSSGVGTTKLAEWRNYPTDFGDSQSWLFNYQSFFAKGMPGDSGGMIGTVVAGEAVLVSLFRSERSGDLLYGGIESEMNAWIQSAAALAGVTITDTVTVASSPI